MMRIDLLGASFQIQSDEDPEYVEEILAYFRDRIREIEETVATGDPLKKAILAAFLVTDELFRCRADGDRREDPLSGEMEAITRRLLDRIDDVLPEAEQQDPEQG